MGLISRLKEQKNAAGKNGAWCSAVIVAAGSSQRMGGTDKLFAELDGLPVLVHTLRPFEACDAVQEIIVVTRQTLLEQVAKLCKDNGISKVTAVVAGGETRADSVMCGLESVDSRCRVVAIHDGARPFVSRRIIDETVRCAVRNGAAAPAIPVKDTIKQAERGAVTQTPERASMYAVQTPQCFDRDLIYAALSKALEDGAELTDDCMAVERIGMRVHLTKGGNQNIKITTPSDLWMAEGILQGRKRYCASASDTTSTASKPEKS